jgi:putative (di)nucleoside polyphosphate hydrolase
VIKNMLIDSEGYRANIGIIVLNTAGYVFWGKRIGKDAWQFPQGGMFVNETPEETLFRELHEEIGLTSNEVEIVSCTNHWLRYLIPKRIQRPSSPPCIGQKQKWYLLKLRSGLEREIKFNFNLGDKPEFEDFCWVSYWYPIREVVGFKKNVYRKALQTLAVDAFNACSANSNQILARPLNLILE